MEPQLMYRLDQMTRGTNMVKALKSDPHHHRPHPSHASRYGLHQDHGHGHVARGRRHQSNARARSNHAPYDRQPGSVSHQYRSASTKQQGLRLRDASADVSGRPTPQPHPTQFSLKQYPGHMHPSHPLPSAGAASTASQQGDVDYLADHGAPPAPGARRVPTKFAKIARLPAGFDDAAEMLSMVTKRRPIKPLNGDLLNVKDPIAPDGPSILDRRFMTRAYRERNPPPPPSEIPAETRYRTGHSVFGLKRRRQAAEPPKQKAAHRR